MHVRPSRSLGSFAPLAWRIKVRRIPSTPPKRPASKTTLSLGEAWADSEGGDADGLVLVQSSRANTKAAKSTSCVSSSRRSSVVVPGLKDVVHGSTCATSSRPRVNACSSFSCFPDEPSCDRLAYRNCLTNEQSALSVPFVTGQIDHRRCTRQAENRALAGLVCVRVRRDAIDRLGEQQSLRVGGI